MKNIATLLTIAIVSVLMSGAAIAGPLVTHVPEPMSMSILAGGVLAIAVVKQFWKK